MPSRQYYDYTVRDKKTNEVLVTGSSTKCAEFLGCERATIIRLGRTCWASEQGFFNSRYIVTREPEKTRGRKHYQVYKGDKLVVEGSSWACAQALGLTMTMWYQLVTKCSMQADPEYIITSELK